MPFLLFWLFLIEVVSGVIHRSVGVNIVLYMCYGIFLGHNYLIIN